MGNSKTAVLVAGSWGTALASVLADNGHDVALWTRNPEQADAINATRRNKRFFPDFELSPRIRATASMEEALAGAEAVVVAATSASMREIAGRMRDSLPPSALVVHATKGFEQGSIKRMSEVLKEELPQASAEHLAVLSGPSLALEVMRRCPTTVVVAAESHSAALAAQSLFFNSYFRVYTNPDVIGVEVGGALKNIIALGAGLSDGLNFGDNAKAALVTRGLAEITRLGVAMGASPYTFAGLAGMGDLFVTCTSRNSRNWQAGYLLAQGKTLDETLREVGMVVEGVKTTKAAYELSRRYKVAMPITEALYAVLFAGKSPLAAVGDLMERNRTAENERAFMGIRSD